MIAKITVLLLMILAMPARADFPQPKDLPSGRSGRTR